MIFCDRIAAGFLDRNLRAQDRARLHLHEIGHHEAESAAAQTLASGSARAGPRSPRAASGPRPRAAAAVGVDDLRELLLQLGRNSCSGGSMRRTTTGRPSIARKMPSKSARWRCSSLAIAASKVSIAALLAARPRPRLAWTWRASLRRDENRGAHDLEALAFAEHVLGAAQADALGAVATGLRRFLGLVGVGPYLHAAELSAQPRIVASSRCSSKRAGIVASAPMKTSPVVPSTLSQSPSSMDCAPSTRARCLRGRVDEQ